MKVSTVNVIEYVNDELIRLLSFRDDMAGNREAEAVFKRFLKANGVKAAKAVAYYTEEGFYESGTYYVCIAHSTE